MGNIFSRQSSQLSQYGLICALEVRTALHRTYARMFILILRLTKSWKSFLFWTCHCITAQYRFLFLAFGPSSIYQFQPPFTLKYRLGICIWTYESGLTYDWHIKSYHGISEDCIPEEVLHWCSKRKLLKNVLWFAGNQLVRVIFSMLEAKNS